MPNTRTDLTAYLRGNFWPPLPHAYVDWVASLLDDMQDAVTDADSGDLGRIHAMIRVPAAVIATGVMPRAAIDTGDGLMIRLGDLISALRLYDHFTTPNINTDAESE